MNYLSCDLLGGLGNQLFQAATTFAHARETKRTFVLEDKPPPRYGNDTQRGNYWTSFLSSAMLVTSYQADNVFNERHDHAVISLPNFTTKRPKLNGFWQSPKYFSKYRDELRAFFRCPKSLEDYAHTQYSQLTGGIKSVAIHVRRGDYVKLNWELPISYYSKAINELKRLAVDTNKIIVLVFSDDHPWCKSNLLPLLSEFKSVKIVNESDDFKELLLMKLADYHIIANSSFSWWGAYLSSSQKVLAPDKWLISNNIEQCPSIHCDHWQRIDMSQSQTVILASNPNLTGRIANKMFQISQLLAMKYTLEEKEIPVKICYSAGEYSCFTDIHPITSNLNSLKQWKEPDDFSFREIPVSEYSSGIMISGFVQSERYFLHYRDRIIKHWLGNPKIPLADVTNAYHKLIDHVDDQKDRHTIAIHIRRGDYTHLSDRHPVIPMPYYLRAIEYSELLHPKSLYLIFTDDKKWAADQDWPVSVKLVSTDNLDPQTRDLYEIILMSRCKSFIIANSTFSWWGAYLSGSSEVVYPEVWFGPSLSSLSTRDLCPPSWHQLRYRNVKNDSLIKFGTQLPRVLRDLNVDETPDSASDVKLELQTPQKYDEYIINAWRKDRRKLSWLAFQQLLSHAKQPEFAMYLESNYQRLLTNIKYYPKSLQYQFYYVVDPQVSVIIPTYMRYEAVRRAIDSVLAQTFKSVEIIVINDGSSDERYKQLLMNYLTNDYFNVTVINLSVNSKVLLNSKCPQGYVRMQGINIARGKYVAFLDDDDIWSDPNKLDKQLAILKDSKYGVQMVMTNMFSFNGFDPTGNPKITGLFHNTQIGKAIKDSTKDYRMLELADITTTNYINNSSVIVSRRLLLDTGGQKAEKYEDWCCWKRIMAHTKCVYMPEPTVLYDMSHAGVAHYTYNF
jgi:GT2 family glycosyltransferase